MRKSFISIAVTFFGILLIVFFIFHMTFIHIFAASPVTGAANPQMMNIACHECGEVITVDISQPEATCSHCGEVNHFSG